RTYPFPFGPAAEPNELSYPDAPSDWFADGRGEQFVLLFVVDGLAAAGRTAALRPGDVDDALVAAQHPAQVPVDEAPGPHVLRFLLGPHQLRLGVGLQRRHQFPGGEGVELLEADDRHRRALLVAPLDQLVAE